MDLEDHRRKYLFDLLASPYGLGYQIVDSYYQDCLYYVDEISHDPSEKIKVCLHYVCHIVKYCKMLRMIRNNLTHFRYLSFNLLNSFILEVKRLSEKETNKKHLFVKLYDKLCGCVSKTELENVADDESSSEPELGPELEPEPESESSEELVQMSLAYIKENYKDKIKHKKVILLVGSYKDTEATFNNWNGTNAIVKNSEGVKIKYSMRRDVLVNIKDLK